jgi:TonB family protein
MGVYCNILTFYFRLMNPYYLAYFWTLILWGVLSMSPVAAQSKKSKMLSLEEETLRNKVGKLDTNKVMKIQNIVKAYAGLKWFSGSIIVAKNGIPVFKAAGGLASLDYKVPCALETKFNLFELSQPFTAIGVVQLAENMQLSFQDPAYKYLPDSLAKLIDHNITIHQLLTHTAGLPNYYNLPNYAVHFLDIKTIPDLLKIILSEPLLFEAGSDFDESPSNYVVLAAIIEQVSKKKYTDYIHEQIFKPTGMKQSDLSAWYQVVTNRAAAYQFSGKHKARTASDLFGAYPFGADAIYSNGEDLLSFDKALRGNVLLGDKYQNIMLTPYVMPDTTLANPEMWGYGWKMKKLNDKTVYYQGGSMLGLSTQMRRYPDDRFTIIVLSNQYLDRAQEVAEKIEKALFEDDYFVPSTATAYLVYDAIQNKGAAYTEQNMDTILAAEELKLNSSQPLNKLASELIYVGDYETALAVLNINNKTFPRDPAILDTYGEYYYQIGDNATAIRYFKDKLAVKPSDKRAAGMIQALSLQKRPIKDYFLPKSDNKTPTQAPTSVVASTESNVNAPIAPTNAAANSLVNANNTNVTPSKSEINTSIAPTNAAANSLVNANNIAVTNKSEINTSITPTNAAANSLVNANNTNVAPSKSEVKASITPTNAAANSLVTANNIAVTTSKSEVKASITPTNAAANSLVTANNIAVTPSKSQVNTSIAPTSAAANSLVNANNTNVAPSKSEVTSIAPTNAAANSLVNANNTNVAPSKSEVTSIAPTNAAINSLVTANNTTVAPSKSEVKATIAPTNAAANSLVNANNIAVTTSKSQVRASITPTNAAANSLVNANNTTVAPSKSEVKASIAPTSAAANSLVNANNIAVTTSKSEVKADDKQAVITTNNTVYSAPSIAVGSVTQPIVHTLPLDSALTFAADTSAPRVVYVANPIISQTRLPIDAAATAPPPVVFNEDAPAEKAPEPIAETEAATNDKTAIIAKKIAANKTTTNKAVAGNETSNPATIASKEVAKTSNAPKTTADALKKIAAEVKQSQKVDIAVPNQPLNNSAKTEFKPAQNVQNALSTPKTVQNAPQNAEQSIKPSTATAQVEPSIKANAKLSETTTALAEKQSDKVAPSPEISSDVERSTAPRSTAGTDSIYTIVHQMPEFPGGQKAAYEYLKQNQIYPAAAMEHNVEGTVYVRFLVTPQGEIEQPFIERGMGANDYGCHAEALRLVKNMPNWEPGMHNGKKVNVRYTLAVSFKKSK